MRRVHRGSTTIVTTMLLAALVLSGRADADGVIFIDSCQTLSIPNTVYKVAAHLTSSGNCLIVAADKITIDLQGHSITGDGQTTSNGIIDILNRPNDLIVVKNGTISGFGIGIVLASNRVSVIGVTANSNVANGIFIWGDQSLVKSSTASFNGGVGIVMAGDRAQVQQSTANNNPGGGMVMTSNCLLTMSTANGNGADGGMDGIRTFGRCTVSYNTANDNEGSGINSIGGFTFGSPSLITHNTAMNNGNLDFQVQCPSDVTFNTSTTGFPASYSLYDDPGCHTVGNQ